MYTYYRQLLENTVAPADIEKDFEKFCKKIFSFSYFNHKHFSKMEIFSKNQKLVEFLCDMVEETIPYVESFEYWFTLLVLAYSNNEKANKYLEYVTDYSIKKQIKTCHILQLLFRQVNQEHLFGFNKKLTDYFFKLYEQSDYFKFVKEIGIDISGVSFENIGYEGYFSFLLTSIEGINYEFQPDTEEEKKKFCTLRIEIYTPEGTEACFNLILNSYNYSIALYHNQKDYYLSDKENIHIYKKETGESFYIENSNKLLELKDIVRQVEEFLEIKFSNKIADFYFPKSIKGKKELQKWWGNR